MSSALVTGSAGLVGSESVRFLVDKGFDVVGIDNNMRQYFFGAGASTAKNNDRLKEAFKKKYVHHNIDIRDNEAVAKIFKKHKFSLVIHTAAQPSHDWAAKEPFTDFSVNATGTLVLLENYRKYCPVATFIFTSTNKVYGDTPNYLPLVEKRLRYEINSKHKFKNGIDETMSIDQTKHSLFGASKAAADLLVQEYGRYFGLHTGIFRGGCITGPAHSAAQLHGFLAYLVACVATGKPYIIFGYKGKQVRDNVHAYDLVNMFWQYHHNPKCGEVYNAGGARHSNVSMLEAIDKAERILKKKLSYTYVDTPRIGDHQWYISDVSKFEKDFPKWKFTYDIDAIMRELCNVYIS
ncbi:MAG: NAD-dependent epimerase/dehydratase family protein [Candidatus Paceibacterota bacterium]|jgi:CDP-paratose 2-epimerase